MRAGIARCWRPKLPELSELLIDEGLDISITGFLPVEIDQLTVDFEENASDPGDSFDSAWLKAAPVTRADSVSTGSCAGMCVAIATSRS